MYTPEELLEALQHVLRIKNTGSSILQIGNKVFIRTVTGYYTGKIVEITPTEVVLEHGAWVAETGRFNEFLANGPGEKTEIEPYPEATKGMLSVNREHITDVSIWLHDLPRTTR